MMHEYEINMMQMPWLINAGIWLVKFLKSMLNGRSEPLWHNLRKMLIDYNLILLLAITFYGAFCGIYLYADIHFYISDKHTNLDYYELSDTFLTSIMV